MMNRLDSILLVDDDESVNFLHKKIIGHLNAAREVFIKNSARDALEFIRKRYYSAERLPSLILLDLKMPGMSGLDFIRELHKSSLLAVKKIPVVILTYAESQEDVEQVRKLGTHAIVNKPLTEDKLLEIIEVPPNHPGYQGYAFD